ncbi:Protein of unknown function [Andreprevotia lacus DSM 23236]|uniref:DUF3426 domain-containing protein n=1 Tax=Andreprevotia lacus DSM 23236 TaxID=1121001 RepID=A0A1W1XK49_9NEIS|nr:Protein of unknown function [Andreprevotia lacus DSM 23236]
MQPEPAAPVAAAAVAVQAEQAATAEPVIEPAPDTAQIVHADETAPDDEPSTGIEIEATPAAAELEQESPAQPTAAAEEHEEHGERSGRYQPIRTLEDEALLTPPPPPSPWRWAWPPLALLALIALIGQLAFTYRTEAIAQLPWLHPHYQRVCQLLGCTLALPTQADLLRSDYSELTYVPGQDSMIQVNASVRNLAPYEQALPMLELTLTDEHEQVVAKKSFSPHEYLVPAERNRSQFPAGDEVHAFLQLELGNLRSTGYSLFWYYP